ncbi:hypothetical protein [Paraflavitalea pollutisoli]|nr:hypothetical protein [Paraflavitalea sp. H1-2-19X]
MAFYNTLTTSITNNMKSPVKIFFGVLVISYVLLYGIMALIS